MSAQHYLLLADLILIIHVVFILFVVLGLGLIYLGYFCHWRWIGNPWFRLTHLGAIGFVVVQTWLGEICPLTYWENTLRKQAGDASYSGDFIAHWLNQFIYFSAPGWVFTLVYSLFGLFVLFSWFWIRPRGFKS
ncbi:DUF2784 domain-containing protein [Aliikangiella marina]|uniref:DUF2784 domain-containing protein n=1 Tax=Aliikangiella marina TaxID=1712262 RepID=A0A545TBW7_9GAMM|nr:DUF2784 domain-containing protein [Aliikangiella marina]TQV74686.1 DUF2784 domain-containing protein [Aliikangiella marina]